MEKNFNIKKGGLDDLHSDFDEGPNWDRYDDDKHTQLAAAAFEKDNKDEDLDLEHAQIRKMLLRGETLPDSGMDSKWDKYNSEFERD